MSKLTFKFQLAFILSLTVVLTNACGRFNLGADSTATDAPDENQETLPPGLLQALQTTLEYLKTTFPDAAPTDTFDWESTNLTPEGLVGSSRFRFQVQEWEIEIRYPVVAPEAVIYTVTGEHITSDLHWEGTIDANRQIIDSSALIQAVAWPGRVIGGVQSDELLFAIEGDVGTVRLTSIDESLITRLQAIRDDTGPQGFVHLWGTLDCSSQESHCRLSVSRIRSGTEITEPEPIGPWEGLLFARTGPPSSGGDDWFTILGDWQIQYGIWARDETLRSEIESLRDTGQVIRIWGDLIVGFSDWNGTQINVTEFELVE